VNIELEMMRKEAVVAKFEVLTRHFYDGTEYIHDNLSQDDLFPDQGFRSGSLETKEVRSWTFCRFLLQ
jgi:hypothetical protein